MVTGAGNAVAIAATILERSFCSRASQLRLQYYARRSTKSATRIRSTSGPERVARGRRDGGTMNDSETKRRFWAWVIQPETMVGLAAIVLSVCGLFVSIYETSLMRTQQRASVWPHVTVVFSSSPGSIALRIENNGVGPARIRAANVSYRGETTADWGALVRTVGTAAGANYGDVDIEFSLVNGSVLATSQWETIFSPIGVEGAAGRLADDLAEAIREGLLDIEVCYCSVYDECWIARLQDVVARSQEARVPGEPPVVKDCDGVAVSGIRSDETSGAPMQSRKQLRIDLGAGALRGAPGVFSTLQAAKSRLLGIDARERTFPTRRRELFSAPGKSLSRTAAPSARSAVVELLLPALRHSPISTVPLRSGVVCKQASDLPSGRHAGARRMVNGATPT